MTRQRRRRLFRDPYSIDELRAIVENYEELSDSRSKAWIHVRLMDIEQAYKSLRPKPKAAVLLCGFIGLTVRTAAILVGVPKSTMFSRYEHGLQKMASYLNGGS